LRGTDIDTPAGHVAVEDMSQGDEILTSDGCVTHVKWIGRQTVSTRFGPAERLRPVRFAAGSLGGGLPLRDLLVTADHGISLDGLICNAGALVNGTTITEVPLAEFDGSYTVYHIETETQDIILAEGVPAETYIDYVGRQAFDNYAEYIALYGEEASITEMPYPCVSSARLLPEEIKRRLSWAVAA